MKSVLHPSVRATTRSAPKPSPTRAPCPATGNNDPSVLGRLDPDVVGDRVQRRLQPLDRRVDRRRPRAHHRVARGVLERRVEVNRLVAHPETQHLALAQRGGLFSGRRRCSRMDRLPGSPDPALSDPGYPFLERLPVRDIGAQPLRVIRGAQLLCKGIETHALKQAVELGKTDGSGFRAGYGSAPRSPAADFPGVSSIDLTPRHRLVFLIFSYIQKRAGTTGNRMI